jgi:hypothetical protein
MSTIYCEHCRDGEDYHAYWQAYDAIETAGKYGERSGHRLPNHEPEEFCGACPSCECGRYLLEHDPEELFGAEPAEGYWSVPQCDALKEDAS